MHDSQSWSQSSPSTAGSTLGKRLPSLAVVKIPSVGRWVEEAVGVRKAAPLRMKPERERAEVIALLLLRDFPIGEMVGLNLKWTIDLNQIR